MRRQTRSPLLLRCSPDKPKSDVLLLVLEDDMHAAYGFITCHHNQTKDPTGPDKCVLKSNETA